jgi:hypothetical protein
MGTDQPTLYFYKSGYRVASADNFLETWMLGNPNWTGDPVRGSEVSGTQIKLERFQGTDLQYVRHLFSAASRLPLNNCQWARIPRLTAALVLEQQRHPWDRGKELPTLQRLEQQSALETGCPGIEVLKPYLK